MVQNKHFKPKPRTRTFTGCLTCRSRKVKCDLKRPSCSNCQRLRLHCRGYDIKLHWLPSWQITDEEGSIGGSGHSPTKSDQNHNVRPRTEMFSERSRHDMSNYLAKITIGQSGTRLDHLLNELEEKASEVRGANAESWQFSQGPFSVFAPLLEESLMSSTMVEDVFHTAPYSPLPGSDGSNLLSWSEYDDGSTSWKNNSFDFYDDVPNYTELLDFAPSPLASRSRSPSVFSSFVQMPGSPRLEQMQMIPDLGIGSLSSSLVLNGSPCLPKNVRFLLSHYTTYVIDSLSAVPLPKAPWKSIHVPCALSAYAELDILRQSSFAKVSLLYSLLSISCYHLSSLYKYGLQDSISIQDSMSSQVMNSDHWEDQAKKYRNIARMGFRKCLEAVSAGQLEKVKYKELLTAAMNLACSGIVGGDTWDTRYYILHCENIIRQIGLQKTKFSEKALNLHRMFSYIQVVEQISFCRTTNQYKNLLQLHSMSDEEIRSVENLQDYPTPIGTTSSHRLSATQLGLGKPEDEFFDEIYGLPGSLLCLISRTNSLIDDLEATGWTRPGAVGMLSASLTEETANLENAICTWKSSLGDETTQYDDNTITSPDNSSPSSNSSTNNPAAHVLRMRACTTTAVHLALIVYFFREIRNTNAIILQHYIERIIRCLKMHQEMKEEHFSSMRVGTMVWPSFVAACDAATPDLRNQSIECLRQASWAGFRNGENAETVVRELWRRRDAGEVTVSWRDVITESQISTVLT